jgi:hypothetical protein
VHDVGCKLTPAAADNPWLRNTSEIAVGQVFTIEPGIYFIPQLLEQLRGEALGNKVNWPLVDALPRWAGSASRTTSRSWRRASATSPARPGRREPLGLDSGP